MPGHEPDAPKCGDALFLRGCAGLLPVMKRMPPTLGMPSSPEDAPGRCLGCPVMNRMPPTLNLVSCLEAYLRPVRSCVPAAASRRRLFGACSRCSWCGPKSRRRKTGRKSFESSYCTAVCSLLACQLSFMRRQRRYSGAHHQGSRLKWLRACGQEIVQVTKQAEVTGVVTKMRSHAQRRAARWRASCPYACIQYMFYAGL